MSPFRLECAVQTVASLQAQCRSTGGMESGCLSRRAPRPLRRLPHASQPPVRRKQQAEICRRDHSRLEGLQHHAQRLGHRQLVRRATQGYLSLGHGEGRGSASGPMSEVVDNSLRYLTAPDIKAMVMAIRIRRLLRSSII